MSRWCCPANGMVPRGKNIPVHEEGQAWLLFSGKPLLLLKQVITMMFSVNAPDFAPLHPELVKFVLNKDCRYLPDKYSVDMVLVRGRLARGLGVYSHIDLNHGKTIVASEVAHYPFAFQLFFGKPPRNRLGPIEQFASYHRDDQTIVSVSTLIGHVATKFGGDYRSADRVEREARAGERLAGQMKKAMT